MVVDVGGIVNGGEVYVLHVARVALVRSRYPSQSSNRFDPQRPRLQEYLLKSSGPQGGLFLAHRPARGGLGFSGFLTGGAW